MIVTWNQNLVYFVDKSHFRSDVFSGLITFCRQLQRQFYQFFMYFDNCTTNTIKLSIAFGFGIPWGWSFITFSCSCGLFSRQVMTALLSLKFSQIAHNKKKGAWDKRTCYLTLGEKVRVTSVWFAHNVVTADSFIKIMTIMEMMVNLRSFDCSMNSPCCYQRKCVEKSMENLYTDVGVLRFNATCQMNQ